MKKEEFWQIYNEKYKSNIQPGVGITGCPLGSDGGVFLLSCFENEKGVWCIEETRERSNTPYHYEYASEDEAFDHFLSIVHSHSKFDGFYIRQKEDKWKRFDDDFMAQINGPSERYEYTLKWPGEKTVYTKIMRCFKTDLGKWYIEVDDGDGHRFSKECDTLEEAKEELYRKY